MATRRRTRRDPRLLTAEIVLILLAIAIVADPHSHTRIIPLTGVLAAGSIIGFLAGRKMGHRAAVRRQPAPAPVRNTRRPAPRARAKTPRLLQPKQFSPYCLNLQCELCDGVGCDCTCKHDPQIIADRNTARYDAEHDSPPPSPDDDTPPF